MKLQNDELDMLLAAILIDTVNLDADKGRGTDKDRTVAAQLTRQTLVDQKQLYEDVTAGWCKSLVLRCVTCLSQIRRVCIVGG